MWAGVPSDSSASSPSATISACRASVFHVAPPMCGVSTTLGRPISGWSIGSHSPSKWSRPAAATLPLSQGADERGGVVQLGAGGVDEHHAVAHGRELLGADHADGVLGDGRMQRDDVGLIEQLVEAVSGLGVERVVGDDRDAEPLQPPPQRQPDRAEADQSGRSPRDFVCAEPLVGDGAVAKHLAGPDVRVGGQHVTGGREQQRNGHLGDRVGVAARGVQHRYPGGGGACDVDVVGITAGGRDGPQRQLEHRSVHRIGLHHKDIGAFCAGAVGQLLGGVDPKRGFVDPRVVDHIGQPAQLVETGSPQRGGHQGARSRAHSCPCWRTVTRVSREVVTIGIDIGTTAVKAVAADEHGQVVARTRIPHELRVPAPDKLEHDATQAWRNGPLAALEKLARPDARAVAVSAMVPSLTAVDADGIPVTPGLLYGDSRGRVSTPTAGMGFMIGEAAEFLRWTARQAPAAAGYWPAPAVANYALADEPVIDVGTAFTTLPLFDGTGWDAHECTDCGASADRMPRVAGPGVAIGQVRGSDAVLAAGAIDAVCEQMVAGADRDGDVLVLCGTTLIVWATIPEWPGGARPVDDSAHGGGQVSDRWREQRRWPVPQLGGSPCRAGQFDAHRSRSDTGVVAVRAR